MTTDSNPQDTHDTTDQRAEADGQEPTGDSGRARAPRQPFYKRRGPLAAMLIALAALIVGYGYYLDARQYVTTDNAFLHGDIIQIAPQVAGRLTDVRVDENEYVREGQLLARIDPADYRVALADAKARRRSAVAGRERAVARLKVARAQVEQARADLAVARSNADNAKADYQRYRQVAEGAVSRQQRDSAKDRYRTTRAKQAAASQRVDASQAQVAAAKTDIESAKAAIAQAEVAIDKAELNLSYTRIAAPADGQVASVGIEAGEYVQPGQQMLAEVPSRVWVKANFKETSITDMRVGQPVDIEIDAYPNRTFEGHVAAIQNATGAEFSVLPPQNATGNFVKIVQRMPVKIVFDARPDVATLGPGLSVVPRVKVRRWQWWPWWPSGASNIVVKDHTRTAAHATKAESTNRVGALTAGRKPMPTRDDPDPAFHGRLTDLKAPES